MFYSPSSGGDLSTVPLLAGRAGGQEVYLSSLTGEGGYITDNAVDSGSMLEVFPDRVQLTCDDGVMDSSSLYMETTSASLSVENGDTASTGTFFTTSTFSYWNVEDGDTTSFSQASLSADQLSLSVEDAVNENESHLLLDTVGGSQFYALDGATADFGSLDLTPTTASLSVGDGLGGAGAFLEVTAERVGLFGPDASETGPALLVRGIVANDDAEIIAVCIDSSDNLGYYSFLPSSANLSSTDVSGLKAGLDIDQGGGRVKVFYDPLGDDNSNYLWVGEGSVSLVSTDTVTGDEASLYVEPLTIWAEINGDEVFSAVYNTDHIELGFYGATPVAKQSLATSPTATQIATVLSNLGLVTSTTPSLPTLSEQLTRTATTDATVTTADTWTVASGKSYLLTAVVNARRTGGAAGATGDSATYIIQASVKDVSGTATLTTTAGSNPEVKSLAEDQAGWAATIDVTGATARVRVTGAVNNNITWDVILQAVSVG